MGKKIVCLGGGIGTSTVIKGLRLYTDDITVAVSMADEGGSSGRLRRLYNMLPPGDIVSCMAAFGNEDVVLAKLLTYRFPGDRYGKDEQLSGHKLGNLILVAMRDITGDFGRAVELFQKTFNIPGTFLPATEESVQISVLTKKGKEVFGEEQIDRGDYDWKSGIEKVFLHPATAKAHSMLLEKLHDADCIIAGPGDLYTTTLPVLIVPGIKEVLAKSKARKIFIVNVTNKPFETQGYSVTDYIEAVKKHLGFSPFTVVIANNNTSEKLEHEDAYSYVFPDNTMADPNITFVQKDLVEKSFPFHHNAAKLAKVIIEQI